MEVSTGFEKKLILCSPVAWHHRCWWLLTPRTSAVLNILAQKYQLIFHCCSIVCGSLHFSRLTGITATIWKLTIWGALGEKALTAATVAAAITSCALTILVIWSMWYNDVVVWILCQVILWIARIVSTHLIRSKRCLVDDPLLCWS